MGEPEAAPLLILCALEAELAPLRPLLEGRPGIRLAVTGTGPRLASTAARRLVPASRMVVSLGCCGALRDGAGPGLLVIPRRVLREEGPVADPDPGWVSSAVAAAQHLGFLVDEGPLLSVSAPLLDPASKHAQATRTGAIAVDMETAAIGAVAAELGRPYLCVRVVLDTVDESLPGASSAEALTLPALRARLQQVAVRPAQCLCELLDESRSLRSAPPR